MALAKRIAVIGTLTVLLVLAAVFSYSTWLVHTAAKTIRLSGELLRRESVPTLADLQRQFGVNLHRSSGCSVAGCQYEITLSNQILAEFHVAPFTALRSAFWVRNGVLEENTLELWTMTGQERMIVAYTDAKYCEECVEFDVVPSEGLKSEVASGSVRVGSRSTVTQKRRAFGFNPFCMSTPKGCGSIAHLVPTVWDESIDGTLRFRR